MSHADSTPNRGKFVRLSRPAIPVVELSGTTHNLTVERVRTGSLVRLQRPAPVVVEDHELALSIQLHDSAHAPAVVQKLVPLMALIQSYESKPGGDGCAWDRTRSTTEPGLMTIVLVARPSEGAGERLRELAKLLVPVLRGIPGVVDVRNDIGLAS